jgi:phosphatidylglycerophosphatase A
MAWLIATCGGLGHMQPGPGTWASGATLLLWWVLARYLTPNSQWMAALLAVALISVLGVWAATSVARAAGSPDPSVVVIDEAAGQMLALIAVPLQWKYLIVSFILFRSFDIFKPPPLRRLERFPGGWGIMLDDWGAGLYALVVVQLLIHSRVFGPFPSSALV